MKAPICLVLSLMIPITSTAECTKPVTLLEQGAPTPCRGYLFTPEKELEVRILKQDSAIDKQEIGLLKQKVDKLVKKDNENENILGKKDQQIDLWRVRAEESTLKLVKYEDNKHTKDLLLVGSGVLLTVLAAWAIGQAK